MKIFLRNILPTFTVSDNLITFFFFLILSRRTSMCKKADQSDERKSLFAKYFFKILEMGFNPFVPNAPFLYPLKTSKPYGFLMFAGRIERVHWEQMG